MHEFTEKKSALTPLKGRRAEFVLSSHQLISESLTRWHSRAQMIGGILTLYSTHLARNQCLGITWTLL